MSHTPGPWQVWPTHWAGGNDSHQYHGHNTIWIDSPNGEVAMVRPDANGKVTHATYANASLIAAAPAMREAIEETVLQIELSGYPTKENFDKLKAALSKARGAA